MAIGFLTLFSGKSWTHKFHSEYSSLIDEWKRKKIYNVLLSCFVFLKHSDNLYAIGCRLKKRWFMKQLKQRLAKYLQDKSQASMWIIQKLNFTRMLYRTNGGGRYFSLYVMLTVIVVLVLLFLKQSNLKLLANCYKQYHKHFLLLLSL